VLEKVCRFMVSGRASLFAESGRVRSCAARDGRAWFWMGFVVSAFVKLAVPGLAQVGMVGERICRIPMLYDSIQATNGRAEYEVKAVILSRFLELARWPGQSASEPRRWRVGIFGKDTFGSSLKLLTGKKISGSKVIVAKVSSLAQARRCQMVFVSSTERTRTPELLNGLADQPVLTVGESPEFVHHGGIINLLLVEKHIELEVNPSAAKKAGLLLHPGLIKLGARSENSSPSAPASSSAAQTRTSG